MELRDGTRGLIWYALWESAASRDRFADGMDVALLELSAEASLERVEVGGVPATVLRVGALEGVTAEARAAGDP